MKKITALALVALMSVGATCGRAQELLSLLEPMEAQFELLRGMRQKGLAAQANEYIDLLLKTADKTNAPLLSLEKARNSVALAKEGKSLDEKTKLLSEARQYFEPFVKGGQKSAAAAAARAELAKLLSIQAQMTLNKALANEEQPAKIAGAKVSRALYDSADSEIKLSVDVLKELAKTNKQFEADLVQAEFDQANNLIDKAQAYINLDDPAENRARAETVVAAMKIFIPIAAKKDTAQGMMANAYLVKCYQESQDPTKVGDTLKLLYGNSEKYAEPALRLARYFEITWLPQNPDIKPKYPGIKIYELVVTSCKDWLKDYPAYRKSYLGEAVRFEQARTSTQIAFAMSESLKPEKIAKLEKKEKAEFEGYLASAKSLCVELEKEKGDFAERAAGLNTFITLKELEMGGSKGPDTSQKFVLKASIEFEKAVKANEKERPQHLKTGLGFLEKGIALAYEEKLAANKIHEYEFIQGSVYYGINDRHRAAISFENLARAFPPSKKGAEAAGQAIQIYKDLADKESDKGARARLHDLVDFVVKQKQWDGEPVQGYARYDLAMDLQSEEKFEEAMKQFEQLPKDFPAYTYAQGQAVFIALTAKKADETPDGKKKWTDEAKKAMTRMGSLPGDANATTSLMWFFASCEAPKFDYADAAEFLKADKLNEAQKEYLAMQKATTSVADAFKKHGDKLAADKKDSVKFTIEVLDKYWRLGLADIEYRKGNYDKVISNELLGATLKDLAEKYAKNPNESIKVKDVAVMVDSVNLALRTCVQMGQLDAAKSMYNIMLKLDAEEGGINKTQLTRSLIADLAEQVNKLKEQKADAKLKEMQTKFAPFVDDLAQQLVFKAKTPEVRDVKNLAKFYGSLNLYKKAADLFKTVQKPKFLDDKKVLDKLTEQQNIELWAYWDMQVEYGRLLRESKEYNEANKILAHVLSHVNARHQLEAEEEQISIYEDRESYGNAIKLWKNYMEGIQRSPKFTTEDYLKKKYFDGFYRNVLCYYKFSQLDKTKKAGKEEQTLTFAANQIVRLEASQSREGWNIIGPRFQELLAKEKPLRDKYQSLKK